MKLKLYQTKQSYDQCDGPILMRVNEKRITGIWEKVQSGTGWKAIAKEPPIVRKGKALEWYSFK